MRRMLSESECMQIMENSDRAVMSMIDADGNPYGIAVNPIYVRESNRIYFHTAKTGRKIDALKANAAVSLFYTAEAEVVPVNYITKYRSVIAEGKAFILDDKEQIVRILHLLCDKYAADDPRRCEVIDRYITAVTIIGIDVLRLTGKMNDGE